MTLAGDKLGEDLERKGWAVVSMLDVSSNDDIRRLLFYSSTVSL